MQKITNIYINYLMYEFLEIHADYFDILSYNFNKMFQIIEFQISVSYMNRSPVFHVAFIKDMMIIIENHNFFEI